MIFGILKTKWNILLFKKTWRQINTHNHTSAGDLVFNANLVEVGNYTYGRLNVLTYDDSSKLRIGNCCSIGPQVCFIVSADHYSNKVSTFPYRVMVLNEPLEGVSKGNIIVDDDVWIGYGSTILSGIHIGQGAIVASGAVVSHDVPPYSIVGGVPAKVIKYRFNSSVIDYLLTLDYGKLDEQQIREHVDDLYTGIENMSLEEVKKIFSWFPKKA